MNQIQKNRLAKKIIERNEYMTVGSYGPSGSRTAGWVSPVAYAYDNNFNFYFISLPDSHHARNFRLHPKVTVAIFDSHQPFGEGVGLQIEGVAKTVRLPQLPHVIRTYVRRKWPYVSPKFNIYLKGFRKVLKNKLYRAYRISPTKVWMNDPDCETDRRIPVDLENI